ncbi:MAG: GspH/FimT family pseudopilin [Thermodesulfobacteriota bacterium]
MRNKSGFSLMELMVVIAIIGIVSALTVPNLITWRNNAQLSRGARQIYSDLQDARKIAIKNNTVITVNFDAGSESYTILRGGSVLATRNMPPGINIEGAVFTALGNVASFDSLGFGRDFFSADNSGAVTISRSGGRTVTIDVSSGGSIRIL